MSDVLVPKIGVPQHLFTDEVWNGVLAIYADEVLCAGDRDPEELFYYIGKGVVMQDLERMTRAEFRFGSIWSPHSKLEVSKVRDNRVLPHLPAAIEISRDPILSFSMYPNMGDDEIKSANKIAATSQCHTPEAMSHNFRERVAGFLTQSGVAVSVISH